MPTIDTTAIASRSHYCAARQDLVDLLTDIGVIAHGPIDTVANTAAEFLTALETNQVIGLTSDTFAVSGAPLVTLTGNMSWVGAGRLFTIIDGSYDALSEGSSGAGWFELANGADLEVRDVGFTQLGRVFDFDALADSGSAPRSGTLRLTRVRFENVGSPIWGNNGTTDEVVTDSVKLVLDDVEVIDCIRGIFIGNVGDMALHDCSLRNVRLVRPQRFGIALGSTLKNPQRRTRRITIDDLRIEDFVLVDPGTDTNCAALFLDAYDLNVSNVHIIGVTADAVATFSQSDKECIYAKAKNGNFNNITIRSSAGNQGLFAFKGEPDDADDPVASPDGAVGGSCRLTNFAFTWDATRHVLSVDATGDTLTLAYLPWDDDTEVTFHSTVSGDPPDGLTDGNTYYIVNRDAYTVQLSATEGGDPIDIVDEGTGRYFIQRTGAGTSITNGIWVQSSNATIRGGVIEGLPVAQTAITVNTSGTAGAAHDQVTLDDVLVRRADCGNAVFRVVSAGRGFYLNNLRLEETYFDGGGAPFIELKTDDASDINVVRIRDCHAKQVEVGNHSFVILNADDGDIDDVIIDGCSMSGAGFDFGIEFDGDGTISNVVIQNVDFSGLVDATKAVSSGLLDGDGGTLTDVWIRNCLGIVTENRGTATLVNGQTSIAVTHGLTALDGFDTTLGADDVLVVYPIETLGNASFWYVDPDTSATQFTIHVDADPGADVDFRWYVLKEKWA